jgi:hypothetical protein
MSTKRPRAVASELESNRMPASSERLLAAMPEPTTTAVRDAEPTSSTRARRMAAAAGAVVTRQAYA